MVNNIQFTLGSVNQSRPNINLINNICQNDSNRQYAEYDWCPVLQQVTRAVTVYVKLKGLPPSEIPVYVQQVMYVYGNAQYVIESAANRIASRQSRRQTLGLSLSLGKLLELLVFTLQYVRFATTNDYN